jgi:hypothetical protein
MKVRISFDRLEDMILVLNDEEIEAANMDDWTYLSDLISDKVADHAMKWFTISDIGEV